jgi:DNA (cytosine-5)-methyltransferase 1
MLTVPKDRKFLTGATFIDLFAGLGGFRLAVESFGGKCVFSSDFDASVADVYEANFGERPAGDITKIDAADIPKHDILCAGFPCQPFSISGKKAGFKDTRGTLFFDIARIVKQHRPKVVFLENVKNFAAHDKGKTLATVVNTLEELGYTVHHKLLNASDYGIPQSRIRVYIVAFRDDLPGDKFKFPAAKLKRCTVNDILETVDSIPEGTGIDVEYELDDNYKAKVPEFSPRPVRIGQIGLGRQGERIYHPRGHGITLAAAGGGIGGKTGLYLIKNRVRRLSPRECARLNGFPDRYKLSKRRTVAYKHFGNSVVIDVLQHILFSCSTIIGGRG